MSDKSLSGNWTGRYDYANPLHGEPVSFDAILTETAASLRGETIEPNSFRPEPTDTLMAVIIGERSGSRVHFAKIYTDFDSDDHPQYSGTVNQTATRISGQWHFPSMPFIHGTFLLARASKAAIRTRAEAAVELEF